MKLLRWLVLPLLPSLSAAQTQPHLSTRVVPIITQNGLRFRDLNKNGKLDPYEDWRLSAAVRTRDLISRMTLEEKAGTMMHGTARSSGPTGGVGFGPTYDTAANRRLIDSVKVTSMITRLGGSGSSLAAQNNALQEIGERTRLGIPLTISTDPRNHFSDVAGTSTATPAFSQWPETLGLAAIGEASLVRRFADIARREYRAAGMQMTLSPQADLAAEPRWGRVSGTFGEDADLAGRMVRAYIEGFQHGTHGVDRNGVAAVVKHWVGYGAQRDAGLDSHLYPGRYATFGRATGPTNLTYWIRPYLGAFAANVAGVMPTYSILEGATWDGRPIEPVGAGFNRQVLTDMLRNRYGYRGLVITDWAITNDCGPKCRNGAPAGERPSFADVGMPWGVEDIPMSARFVKAVRAGVDQFGGSERADLLVAAVRGGELTEARVDSSVARVLRQKFALGLFEDPFVDTAVAARTLGNADFRAAGLEAQRRALVLLKNNGSILPLRNVQRVYVRGIDSAAVRREGWQIVTDPQEADVAIIRLGAPKQMLHPQYVFGQFMPEGSLAFTDSTPGFTEFTRVATRVPTIAVVYLDRPAVLTPIQELARAVIGSFGVSDRALLDVLTGRARPEGKLPFDLPRSMESVTAQRPDVAHDVRDPLYPFGFGLRY